LNEKQLVDYTEHRWAFIEWLRTRGKSPEKPEGYSDYSVYGTAYRCAAYDRWVWDLEERYTVPPTTEHADAYMLEVAHRDVTTSTKGKIEEALIRYHRWIAASSHTPAWDREQQFRSGGSDHVTI
jgi:hypothetical protein